jgi:hypothetical protein
MVNASLGLIPTGTLALGYWNEILWSTQQYVI